MKSALLLFPNLIADHKHHELFLPPSVDKAVATIDGLIAESEKEGRRFLGRFKTKKPAHDIPLALYNKNTPDEDLDFFLEPMVKGERWGLISDNGLPCIADPGAKIVARARKVGIPIQAFVGPSSIMLALMQSGLNGQSFSFHGYLDKEREKFKQTIVQLEAESKKKGVTQIFMERPFSNKHALECLLETLKESTLLCVASELTSPEQMIMTQTVALWKKSPLPAIDKKNTLFLLLSP
jgi:16S rRNA (cytidine1402-2'-O)-methyltransferase